MSPLENCDVTLNGSTTFGPIVDWPELLNRVKQNEIGAIEELFSLIAEGIFFFLRRKMPARLAQERGHHVFMGVLKAIQDGRIENANTFPGYLMTVIKGQLFAHLRSSVSAPECTDDFAVSGLRSRAKDNPDYVLEAQQRSTLVAEVLKSMSPNAGRS